MEDSGTKRRGGLLDGERGIREQAQDCSGSPLTGAGQIYRRPTATNRRRSTSAARPTRVAGWADGSVAAHIASPVHRAVTSSRVVLCGQVAPLPFNRNNDGLRGCWRLCHRGLEHPGCLEEQERHHMGAGHVCRLARRQIGPTTLDAALKASPRSQPRCIGPEGYCRHSGNGGTQTCLPMSQGWLTSST